MTTSGANYGGRLGFYAWGIGMGVDYMSSSQTITQAGQKSDFKPEDYGVFFKYNFLGDFKLYGTYFFVSNSKIQAEENTKNFTGSGYKIGLGWKVLSFLEIGIELINRNYSKYDSQALANTLLGSTAGLSIGILIL